MFQRVQITLFAWEERSIRISPCTIEVSCVFFTLQIIQSNLLLNRLINALLTVIHVTVPFQSIRQFISILHFKRTF